MNDQVRLRELLLEQLTGRNAHLSFSKAVADVPFDDIKIRPNPLPHSIWELAEHIRIAQHDILDFSCNPHYKAINWPDDYWPSSPEPESPGQWDETLHAFADDHQAVVELIKDPQNDLMKPIEHGEGQTLFREAILIVDHNAYHIGQIIQLRRLLGNWE